MQGPDPNQKTKPKSDSSKPLRAAIYTETRVTLRVRGGIRSGLGVISPRRTAQACALALLRQIDFAQPSFRFAVFLSN